MLRPGFEPGSSAREAEMIDRTTLPKQMVGLTGFEPAAIRLRAECSDQAELQTRVGGRGYRGFKKLAFSIQTILMKAIFVNHTSNPQ